MASSSSTVARRLVLAALRFLAEDDEHGDEEDHDHYHEEETDHYNNSNMTFNETFASEFDSHDAAAASETTPSEQSPQQQPWGDVILASLLIQTVTITGLIVSTAMKNCCGGKNPTGLFWTMVRHLVIPSFAGGALLATTVFLIIPEALHLVPLSSTSGEEEEHHEDEESHTRYRYLQEHVHEEPDQPWKVGTAILGGFLFPMLFWILFPGNHHHGGGGDGGGVGNELDSAERHHEGQQQHGVLPNELETSKNSINSIPTLSPCIEDHTTGTMQDTTQKMDLDEEEYNDDDYEYDDDGKVIPLTTSPKILAASNTPQDEKKGVVVNKANESPGGAAAVTAVDALASAKLVVVPPRKINYTLAASILVGDFFHNFTDGVFLGSAFSTCSRELGYTLVASTVYHELAQEIADFFLLTHHCGLLQWEAVVLNFIAGFSVMIGALMVLALDMSDTSKGIVLSLSAGVYLHISASECIPRAQSYCKTSKDALIFLLCFILGAVPIGLVLLNHGHCEAEGVHEER
jgi:zinc transporter ZupT